MKKSKEQIRAEVEEHKAAIRANLKGLQESMELQQQSVRHLAAREVQRIMVDLRQVNFCPCCGFDLKKVK